MVLAIQVVAVVVLLVVAMELWVDFLKPLIRAIKK